MSGVKRHAYFSESLARGLLILRAFDRESPRLRVGPVAERTGLSRAAARRFLLTLCDLGYMACEDGIFFLRPRVLDLGYHYLSSADVGILIQPLLAELAERTQEATTFGVLDGRDVLIVARAAKRKFDLSINSGSRLPLLKTALGHVLLAGLNLTDLGSVLAALRTPQSERDVLERRLKLVRRQGYAIIQGQLAPKLVAVAVPIFDKHERVAAAINLTSYTMPLNRERIVAKFLPLVTEIKSQIEAALRSSESSTLLSGTASLHSPGRLS